LSVDPNGFFYDERYGYYYIEDKATLNIKNCVKIFDARFAVYEGGTLLFDDYSQILGYEDVVNNLGRYKIRGEGGAILRNYKDVQYVQNANINQIQPLHYIATSSIDCGDDVDPDTDQPIGPYSILNNTEVTFEAGHTIHLTGGFSVYLGGNFHAYVNNNIAVPEICTANNFQNGGNRSQATNDEINNPSNGTSIISSPNPNNGSWRIASEAFMQNITIKNYIGQTIFDSDHINSQVFDINIQNSPKGIYFVIVRLRSGEIETEKMIVE